METQRESANQEKPNEASPKVDPDERFSLYPLATDEALRALLAVDPEADTDKQDD